MAKVYRELAINHEEYRRYEDAGEFNYRSWDVERSKEGNGPIRKALLNMHWFLSGYWERPWRALGNLALMWLLFAVAYSIEGIPKDHGSQLFSQLVQASIYSAGNLTLQSSILAPDEARWSQLFVVTFERIVGPVQIGFLALSLRRKFIR